MTRHSIGPRAAVASIWRWRDLLLQMTERDVRSRYRSSAAGLLWSVAGPLVMLGVYTFFFTSVFTSRWSAVAGNKASFALILFVGLLIHGFASEALTRAPDVVVAQPNLVKKVVFPLELLPVIATGSALFHMLVGFGVWLIFHLVLHGVPGATALLFPIVLLPLLLIVLGFAWMLAALGVYLRDVTHVVPMVVAVALFASPIFYPRDALAEPMRSWIVLNPLTIPVEELRDILLWNHLPDAGEYALYLAVASIVAWLGFAWFQGTRNGFADVL